MKISVVIPALNAQQSMELLYRTLVQQTTKPYEIIVIDSSSTDNTVRLARELGCIVRVIPQKKFDHGGTRNLGAQMASGDVVVYMTQDAIPRNEYFLERLVDSLNDPLIAASFGRQVALPDATPIERFTREFNYPPRKCIKSQESLSELGIKTFFFSDVCSAVRKADFIKVGCYPERIIMNEDMILAARLILAGYKIAYMSDAEVLHSHNYGLSQQFKRNFDIGVSHSQNKWLLEYARAEGEGYRYVKEQFYYLIRNGQWVWIPSAFVLTVAKYAGYKFGLNQDRLPLSVKKKFSMHKNYWDNAFGNC